MARIYEVNFGDPDAASDRGLSVVEVEEPADAYADRLQQVMAPDAALPPYLRDCAASDMDLVRRLMPGLGRLAASSNTTPKNTATN